MGEAGNPIVLAANFSDAQVEVPVCGELVYSFTAPQVGEASTTLDPWGFAVISTQ